MANDPKVTVERLIAAGMSESEIAKEVGVSQPTINRIRRGRQTSYETGAALVQLGRSRLSSKRSGASLSA